MKSASTIRREVKKLHQRVLSVKLDSDWIEAMAYKQALEWALDSRDKLSPMRRIENGKVRMGSQ